MSTDHQRYSTENQSEAIKHSEILGAEYPRVLVSRLDQFPLLI
jgi:hypothetical protein